ncbi:hypothetical protein [Steroidobacter denitrificans]|uniref:hypothetical protein n=1 Tax=Steroidobacter denitrificans TaxID=465721 RepID=UPI0012EEA24C|nr:hypothetical protein [Steroidobacter denitrificans]
MDLLYLHILVGQYLLLALHVPLDGAGAAQIPLLNLSAPPLGTRLNRSGDLGVHARSGQQGATKWRAESTQIYQ